jgi:hypothetical protein
MPFDGENDKEIATNIAYNKIDFADQAFSSITMKDKSFINSN